VDPFEPSLFYTGLVAEMYSPLRSEVPDPVPYAGFIAAVGEPALELGCGDGDPLLDLRSRGLEVEGLDSSPDMLRRCRRRAAERGLRVVLHLQQIQRMHLPRRYRSIFVAGATFNLLVDDDTARQGLKRIHAHLEPGGSALIPLFVPDATPSEQLGQYRVHRRADGALLRVAVLSEERDDERRRQTAVLRYERHGLNETAVVERPWALHWHTQDGFRSLAESAGLAIRAIVGGDGEPVGATARQFNFWLTRPR
jgi:hypothetical protein